MSFPDRTQAPPFHLSTDYSLPSPEEFSIDGDLKIFAFRDLHLDVVKLELIFSSGKWYEPAKGISHFTSMMLSKGTKTKNSFEIAKQLDTLGAYLEVSPGYDWVTVSLFSLRKNFLKATEILSDLLSAPSFEEDELRLMTEIFVQNLRVNNEKTSVVSSKEIRKAVFGADHPYGSSVEEGDAQKIRSADLAGFFKNEFSLHSIFLVGRLTDAEIRDLIHVLPGGRTRVKAKQAPVAVRGASHVIAKPGSVQASIRIAKRCVQKSDTDAYFDTVAVNHILGGYFGSRLMKNIREEKGLTYGIYSSLNHFSHDSFWLIGAEVNQQNAVEATREIKFEIKKLCEDLLTLSELNTARNYFIGSWQSENSTFFSVAEKIRSIYLWGLPSDYYSNLLERLRAVSPEEIRAAAASFFSEEDLITVQVG